MGVKLDHELAANDGTITFARDDSSGHSGNMLILTGYRRLEVLVHPHQQRHARYRRRCQSREVAFRARHRGRRARDSADSSSRTWATAARRRRPTRTCTSSCTVPTTRSSTPTRRCGSRRVPARTACAPTRPTRRAHPADAAGPGFWTLGGDGTVLAFGTVPKFGNAPATTADDPYIAIASTPSGQGYWTVDVHGHVDGVRRRARLWRRRYARAEPTGARNRADDERQRLLASGTRRRHLQLRRRALLRLDRQRSV